MVPLTCKYLRVNYGGSDGKTQAFSSSQAGNSISYEAGVSSYKIKITYTEYEEI